MHILLDLLHLVAAATLALLGLGYEREAECPPVRFQPAAIVAEADADAFAVKPTPVADCEDANTRIEFPAL